MEKLEKSEQASMLTDRKRGEERQRRERNKEMMQKLARSQKAVEEYMA